MCRILRHVNQYDALPVLIYKSALTYTLSLDTNVNGSGYSDNTDYIYMAIRASDTISMQFNQPVVFDKHKYLEIDILNNQYDL